MTAQLWLTVVSCLLWVVLFAISFLRFDKVGDRNLAGFNAGVSFCAVIALVLEVAGMFAAIWDKP